MAEEYKMDIFAALKSVSAYFSSLGRYYAYAHINNLSINACRHGTI